MRNKLINILLGFVLILAGILYIFKDIWDINFTSIIFMLVGICFMTNYIRNNNRWAVIPAIYLILFSGVDLLLRGTDIFSVCISSVFYFAPGILFLIWYHRNRKSSFLTLGCLFNAIGIDIILYYFIHQNGISLLLLCIGIALLLSYIIYGNYMYKGKLYIGLFVIIISVANLIDIRSYVKYSIPAILIVVGIAIIINTLSNNEER